MDTSIEAGTAGASKLHERASVPDGI